MKDEEIRRFWLACGWVFDEELEMWHEPGCRMRADGILCADRCTEDEGLPDHKNLNAVFAALEWFCKKHYPAAPYRWAMDGNASRYTCYVGNDRDSGVTIQDAIIKAVLAASGCQEERKAK